MLSWGAILYQRQELDRSKVLKEIQPPAQKKQ